MQFRLRYLAHDIELPPGEFVIGRADDCQLALDDGLVSRRHVMLRVSSSSVVLVDLGSRNGVSLNGERMKTERRLEPGDKIQVGGVELTFEVAQGEVRRSKAVTETLGNLDLAQIQAAAAARGVAGRPETPRNTPRSGGARMAASLPTLATLADKALALGRAEEAERIVGTLLLDLMKELRAGRELDATVLDRAAGYAVKIGAGIPKASWIDWVFEAYYLSQRLLPATLVDELYTVVRKVRGIDTKMLRDYAQAIRDVATSYSPNERFLLQRIEGLLTQLTSPA